jgi:hypothetical protein
LEASVNGAFRRCIELINDGEVYKARAVLTRYVVRKDTDNPAAWALMAHLVDDRAEEIHCLEQVLRLQPDNHYARYRLLSLRNNGTVHVKPLATTVHPFRFNEQKSWSGGVDLSSSWIMPQGRRSKASRGLLGWGIRPDPQAAWPLDLKFCAIMSPFSEGTPKSRKPLRLSPAFRWAIDKLFVLVILSAMTLLF